MTWVHWSLLAFFLGLPMALFFAYAIGIQYQREAWPVWMPLLGSKPFPQWLRDICEVVAAIALLIDVPANWTVLSLYFWEWPGPNEYTFSTRLERLVTQTGWRSRIAWPIARLLNRIAPPGHPHIKNAVEVADA